MAHFEIKDLSFSYPVSGSRPALNHINLNIEKGQYVTLCGKSGAGNHSSEAFEKCAEAPWKNNGRNIV